MPASGVTSGSPSTSDDEGLGPVDGMSSQFPFHRPHANTRTYPKAQPTHPPLVPHISLVMPMEPAKLTLFAIAGLGF